MILVTRGYGPGASIALVVTRGYIAGTAAVSVSVAVRPTGGWSGLDIGETPEQSKARIKRERQALGIVPPDPEPRTARPTAYRIGAATPDPERKSETAPLTDTERERRAQAGATAIEAGAARARQDDEDIAVLLLMAA